MIGIYKLQFADGSTYIGQSVDIEKRIQQHTDKMLKGTHTKAIQAAYRAYGLPRAYSIFECDADHLDIAENTFIARLTPSLNGVRSPDPLAGMGETYFNCVLDELKTSTLDHIGELTSLRAKLAMRTMDCEKMISFQKPLLDNATLYNCDTFAVLEKELETTQKLVSSLQEARSNEEVLADTNNRISTINSEKLLLEADNAKLLAYKNLPWWKKLF